MKNIFMFQIFILHINLDIHIGFFKKKFGYFRLPLRIQLIILQVEICFETPYKTYSCIFTFQIRYGSSSSVRFTSDFRFFPSRLLLVVSPHFFVHHIRGTWIGSAIRLFRGCYLLQEYIQVSGEFMN